MDGSRVGGGGGGTGRGGGIRRGGAIACGTGLGGSIVYISSQFGCGITCGGRVGVEGCCGGCV